ncbi:hypothetical protein [Nocardioides ferulae]|uniref:hypothetical protein n=1 Tax=Nocardioides ferulae TaxID=2340821 RepID=UPI000EB14B77|nr:hypothetical protein [Nocardioides ferulae]
MTVETSEYDRFGPWVEEVTTEREVPRLFRVHPLDLGAARLVLKVPRNIARRDATPSMHLYDHLLALESDRLTVLSRPSGPDARGSRDYEVRHSAYADVVAVLDEVNMLEGHLRVHTSGGEVVAISYNGAANAQPRRLAEELRRLAVAARGGVRRSPRFAPAASGDRLLAQSALGDDDIGVVNAHRVVAEQRPELTILACHRRHALKPGLGGLAGARSRLSHALKPAVLHAGIVAADGDTLELFGRRHEPVRGRMAEYSLSRAVLLTHALDRVEREPHPVYPGATVLTFVSGRSRLRTTVPTGSDAQCVLTGVTAR